MFLRPSRVCAVLIFVMGLAVISGPMEVKAAEPVVVILQPEPLTETELNEVIINDPNILVNFSLARTVGQIQTTAGKENTEQNRINFVDSLLASFELESAKNGIVSMPITPRPSERGLIPTVLLDSNNPEGMKPVALTNRLDLMPEDGTHCGEQRIIYERGNGLSFTGRMTLIFEATIENPNPTLGIEGCKPIAKFWSDLSKQTLSQDQIRTRLENFFYNGKLPSGQKITPPVHFLHYGNPFGAIRINTFINSNDVPVVDWLLRQYRTKISADGFVKLVTVPIAESPWREVYEPVSAGDSQALKTLKKGCQKEFHTTNLKAVTDIELQSGKDGPDVTNLDLISTLGVRINDFCNGFENNSTNPQAPTSPPNFFDNNFELEVKVEDALNAQADDMPYTVSSFEMANRVNTQSCAGCHELSNGQPIADGVFWPPSLAFVHINEEGRLSQLLTDHFLPARFKVMNDFLKGLKAEKISRDITVANAQKILNLQQKIISGALQSAQEDSLVKEQRAADHDKNGALVKIRPTH